MTLDDATKDFIRRGLDAHVYCGHNDASLCYTLTLIEAEIRRGEEFSEEEVEASRIFIADSILEGLILKGMIEPVGIDPDSGDFYVGLTAAGEEAYEHIRQEKGEEHGQDFE